MNNVDGFMSDPLHSIVGKLLIICLQIHALLHMIIVKRILCIEEHFGKVKATQLYRLAAVLVAKN